LEIPGLESEPAAGSPPEAENATSSESKFHPSGPEDDGIAPLDADGVPQSGPDDARHTPQLRIQAEPQHVLPDPPGLPPQAADDPQEPPRKKNLWQKSTDKIRTLTRPEQAEKPADGSTVNEKSPKPNWQLLKRSPQEPAKSTSSAPARQQLQLQQQQRIEQQRTQQLQQQRLQMQRLEQQRQLQRRANQSPALQNQPQSRWQSAAAPPSNRGQTSPSAGASGQTSSRRQVQGSTRPQYQPPRYQPPRPQQGQQKRAVDPRSVENVPHAPWDIQPGATRASKPVARPVASRPRGAGRQAGRVNSSRVMPR
jgi:hypothetical protein